MTGEFSHIDRHGHASMVDVTHKATTYRQAWARCRVVGVRTILQSLPGPNTLRNVLEAAHFAGVHGAKATSSLIPLCHPLPLTDIALEFIDDGEDVLVAARAETMAQTGVEMEALSACAVAALSIVAAVKAGDPNVHIEELTLWEKRGGRSGIWRREGATVVHEAPTA